jgi:transcriptional regulator with XRE-family HTH domain
VAAVTLYDRVAATPGGARRLADARLRHEALHLLWQAQAASKLSVEQMAAELGVRRRAVRRVLDGNGDISVGTLARYLHAMGYEVELRLVAAGEPRRKVVEGETE